MYDAVNGNDRERVCHDDDDKREIRVEWVKTPPKDFFLQSLHLSGSCAFCQSNMLYTFTAKCNPIKLGKLLCSFWSLSHPQIHQQMSLLSSDSAYIFCWLFLIMFVYVLFKLPGISLYPSVYPSYVLQILKWFWFVYNGVLNRGLILTQLPVSILKTCIVMHMT